MTGRPMVEQQSNGTPVLSPNHLLPSAISTYPPPTASSLSSSQRPQSGVSGISSSNERYRDGQFDGAAVRKTHSHSISSSPHTLASSKASTSADNRDRQRAVRTLPPWVQSTNEDDNADPTSLLLPRTPTNIRPASHNHLPTPKANAVAGRHYDHAREGTPVTISTPVSEQATTWKQFTKASHYERPTSAQGVIMSDAWIAENLPDLEEPWHPMDKEDAEEEPGFWLFSSKKRSRRWSRAHRTLMVHPMVPLVVRLIVLIFSVMALALSGAIFHRSEIAACENNSSTWMAIIVDSVAIAYTSYITFDEYTSKPLGLRSHNAKMRLIFLDLAFIVFDSANLSLAFQALTDERWVCKVSDQNRGNTCPFSNDICARQKVLTATLFIALLAWLTTFAVSTLRLINRVAR